MASSSNILRAIERAIAPLRRQVRLAIARAVVSLIDDSAKAQRVQVKVLADEVHDGVEHFQPYGLTAHPPADSEGVFLSVGGVRSHGIVICVGSREYRLKPLESGEVALYSRFDNFVLMKADGSIEVVGSAVRLGTSDASAGAARNGDAVQVEIPAGSVIVSVTGGGGVPAVGVPNAAPISLTGTITEGSAKVKVAD